jgi:uncharacterized protein (DUF362 family)
MPDHDTTLSRRSALKHLAYATSVGAAATAAGVFLSARSRRPLEEESLTWARAFNVPPDVGLPELVFVHGEDPRGLVRVALESLGGMRRFVSSGDVVLVKPNIAWDRVPEQAANTNPWVVAEVVKQAKLAGAKRVVVTEVSCNDPRRCFKRSGIAEAAEAEGAEVIIPDDRSYKRVDLKRGLGSWPILALLFEADKVINVPVAKHHSLSGVTLGIKNWMGVLGGQREWLHQRLDASLVDLADALRPTLTILDAYRVLVRNGPTGGSTSDVITPKVLLASTDPVAVDTCAAKSFFGLASSRLPYLGLAKRRGLGKVDLSQVRTLTIDMQRRDRAPQQPVLLSHPHDE